MSQSRRKTQGSIKSSQQGQVDGNSKGNELKKSSQMHVTQTSRRSKGGGAADYTSQMENSATKTTTTGKVKRRESLFEDEHPAEQELVLSQASEPNIQEELKFKNEQADYVRIARKPLLFGMDEYLSYNGHGPAQVKNCIQNFNNKVFASWDSKMIHFWNMQEEAKIEENENVYPQQIKLIDITKTHCTVACVAFSHKYRVYLIVTSEFKMFFVNELNNVVSTLDMSAIRLVNFAVFNDKHDQLVTAGIEGVFIHNLKYTSKYKPKTAAQIDTTGQYIKIELTRRFPVEKMLPWVKGMNVDLKNGIITTWSQGGMSSQALVAFNHLNNRQLGAEKDGDSFEKLERVKEALQKLIKIGKEEATILEGSAIVNDALNRNELKLIVISTDLKEINQRAQRGATSEESLDQKTRKEFLKKAKNFDIPVLQIGSREQLGIWLGHCKYDRQNKPTKVKSVQMFGLKDYGDDLDSFSKIRGFVSEQGLAGQQKAGDLISLMKDLLDTEEMILDVQVFVDFRYFLTSTDQGNIFVWKYVNTKKVETQKRLIHSFTGHQKSVTSIMPMKNYPNLFTSASLDGTAKIWTLDTFLMLYSLEIPGTLQFCTIFNRSEVFVSQTEDRIQVHRFGMILENYLNSETLIKEISGGYESYQDYKEGNLGFTMSLCVDNSAFVNDVESKKSEYPKCTLYPPPSAQKIIKMVYSYVLDRFIVLLSSSTLCVYKRVKETALLERILDPSEIRDCESKRAFQHSVTCMQLVRTSTANEITPFDTEVLNQQVHESSIPDQVADKNEHQEFLVLGLAKGGVIIFHIENITQLFCRFSAHREAIQFVNYLPTTRCYVSFCAERDLKIWYISEDRRCVQIQSLKLNRPLMGIHVLNHYMSTLGDKNETEEVNFEELDVASFTQKPIDRFAIAFENGDAEIFDLEEDFSGVTASAFDRKNSGGQQIQDKAFSFYHVENERQRDHEMLITGVDSSNHCKLIVTGDSGGTIRLWTYDKRFIREIQFPHAVEHVCFLNKQGDILVSHSERISKIKFETYWTTSFTHFGITKVSDPIHQKYLENEACFETELLDEFVVDKPAPTRTAIFEEEQMNAIWKEAANSKDTSNNLQNEQQHLNKPASKQSEQKRSSSNLHSKVARNSRANLHQSQQETSQNEEITSKARRLNLQQVQTQPMTTSMMTSKQAQMPLSTKLTNALQAINMQGVQKDIKTASYEQGADQKTENQRTQRTGRNKAKRTLSIPVTNRTMDRETLEQMQRQSMLWQMKEAEENAAEKLRLANGPKGKSALPKENNGFARQQVLQPLPGVSYLSTTPVYFEMQQKRNKAKGGLQKGSTRRHITQNRISTNIMNFNQATVLQNFEDMELSVDYHTEVSQSKYLQSDMLPLMNLQILSKMPVDHLLNNELLNQSRRPQRLAPLSNTKIRLDERASRGTNHSQRDSIGGGMTPLNHRGSFLNETGKDSVGESGFKRNSNQIVVNNLQGQLRSTRNRHVPHLSFDSAAQRMGTNRRGQHQVHGGVTVEQQGELVKKDGVYVSGKQFYNTQMSEEQYQQMITAQEQQFMKQSMHSSVSRRDRQAHVSQTTQDTSKMMSNTKNVLVSPTSIGISKNSELANVQSPQNKNSLMQGDLASIQEDSAPKEIIGQNRVAARFDQNSIQQQDSILSSNQPKH